MKVPRRLEKAEPEELAAAYMDGLQWLQSAINRVLDVAVELGRRGVRLRPERKKRMKRNNPSRHAK